MSSRLPVPPLFTEPIPRTHRLTDTVVVSLGCCVVLALAQTTTIHLMRRFGTTWPWTVTFGMTLPSWLVLAAASPVITWAAGRYSFEPRNRRASVIVHSLLSLGFGILHLAAMSATYYYFWPTTRGPADFGGLLSITFRNLFVLELLTYWAIVGIYLVLHYSKLKASLAEARLAALQSQLNPHFLFNTLNAISTLAMKGDRQAVVETLGRLSDLLRASLEEQKREIPLSREIDFLESYIAIQKLRFADRLSIDMAVEPDALLGLVPPMTLQPLVENAVVHGGVGRNPSLIRVSAARQQGDLVVEVSDNGPGFPSGGLLEGLGLSTTRERLEQLYGRDQRVEYGLSQLGGASVRITLPFRAA